MNEAQGKMSIGSWEEVDTFAARGTKKHSRVSAKKTYTGDLQGESDLNYLLCYTDKETSFYIGYERITGELEGKKGSFVMKLEGFYGDGAAIEKGEIVVGAGTGALAGLRGEMTYEAKHDEQTHDVFFQYGWQ